MKTEILRMMMCMARYIFQMAELHLGNLIGSKSVSY